MSIMSDPEPTHVLLYEAHWALVKANERIHAAIVQLTMAGRYSEAREKLAPSIGALERARELIDSSLREAGDGRTKLIHVTGCDGTCSDRAEKKS